VRGRGEAEKIELAVFGTFYVPSRSLRSLRLSVSKRISKPVNAEAQRNAEGARSGRKIGEDEDGMGGVQEGIFCWIALDCRSLRSPRLSVSKKILRTAKRRGAEHRRGCAVGERIGTLYGILIECKSLRSLRLCVSRKGSEPVNAEAQRNAEGARSGEGDWNFLWNAYRMQISAFSASLRFKEGILRTGKRRGAEERGGYAVGEKDWRGRGWEGRSSGRDFLLDFSRLQISVSGRFKRGQF